MRITTNKNIAVIAVAAVALTGTGVAYAYWTTSGSGSGSATVDAAADTLTLHVGSQDLSGLAPGQPVTFNILADSASDTNLRVTTVKTAVSTTKTGCDATDITVTDLDASAVNVLADAEDVNLGSVTMSFAQDTVDSQDKCKGAPLTLTFTTTSTATSGS